MKGIDVMEWLKYIINYPQLQLSTLQFANKERLKYNKNFCIFDEVGTGKTISSGIIILEALCNKKITSPLINKNVLIITTGLGKVSFCSDYGITEEGFNDKSNRTAKLPFREVVEADKSIKIKVISNHYSNIKKEAKMDWGIVVIDEAHLFLNRTKRRSELEKLNAEKVIVLTATPVINSELDFIEYETIVKNITNEEIVFTNDKNQHLIDIMNNGTLISSEFNLRNCVTRYFKETMQCFVNNVFNQDNSPKRNMPKILNYTTIQDKDVKLLKFIEQKIDEEKINRFVIFVMTVGNEEHPLEARKLEELFRIKGYEECIPNNTEGVSDINNRSYLRISGDVAERQDYINNLKNSNSANIPTILIITYQIGQQAINLPQYNNIINYYISATPGALEQRCGRIDRRGKTWEINFYNMLSEYSYDLNNYNFNNAVYSFINLIHYFPSKNCVLTKDTLKYLKIAELMKEYEKLIECFDNEIDEAYDLLNDEIEDADNVIYTYCKNNEIVLEGQSKTEFIIYLKELIERKRKFLIKNKENIDELEKQISSMYNKVLYIKDNVLQCKDTEEMSEEIKKAIKPFQDKFEDECKISIIINRKREEVERVLENCILTDKIHILINKSFDNLEEQMTSIFKDDYETVKSSLEEFMKRLPVFELISKIIEIIKESLVHTYDGYMRKNKLDCMFAGHYTDTFQYIGLQLYYRSKSIDISDEFRKELFNKYEINEQNFSFKNYYDNNLIINKLIKACMDDKNQCALVIKQDGNKDILERGNTIWQFEQILEYYKNLSKKTVPFLKFEEVINDVKNNVKELMHNILNHIPISEIEASVLKLKYACCSNEEELVDYKIKLLEWLEEYCECSQEYSNMSYEEKYDLKLSDYYFQDKYLELREELEYIKGKYEVYKGCSYNSNSKNNKVWYDVSSIYEKISQLKKMKKVMSEMKDKYQKYIENAVYYEWDDDDNDFNPSITYEEYSLIQEEIENIDINKLDKEIRVINDKLSALEEDEKCFSKDIKTIRQYLQHIGQI